MIVMMMMMVVNMVMVVMMISRDDNYTNHDDDYFHYERCVTKPKILTRRILGLFQRHIFSVYSDY